MVPPAPQPVAPNQEQPEVVQLYDEGNEGNSTHTQNAFVSLFGPPKNANSIPLEQFELPAEAFRCADDSVTLHVPNDVWHKIWSGQYINLALLLKKTHEVNSSGSLGNLYLSEQGQIEMRPKQTKTVQNIREWTDAFIVFMFIHMKKFPDKCGDLLQYCALIREAESRSGGSMAWRTYDENFRMRQALQAQSWASLNYDLWLRIMSFTSEQTPAVAASASAGQAYSTPSNGEGKRRQSPGICYHFNKAKGCSYKTCRFTHVCLACRGPHRQLDCPRSFPSQQSKGNPRQESYSKFGR